jgi:FlaA1/EpsC-like NDP-sugar epimerase
LFKGDIETRENSLASLINSSSFMVIGGAGSIAQAATREIFKRDPLALHVVDIFENNMLELVRDFRNTEGYGSVDFRTFALGGRAEF